MTKKYMMVWGGVVVFVFAAVTILCLYAKKNNINNISENMTVEKAEKYFNLLKQDALMHKNDYYDIDEEIKYSDIKYILSKDDEEIEIFTIR